MPAARDETQGARQALCKKTSPNPSPKPSGRTALQRGQNTPAPAKTATETAIEAAEEPFAIPFMTGRRAFMAACLALLFFAVQPCPAAAARPAGRGKEVMARLGLAIRHALGKPYRWGAAGPHAFDCSGLMVWLYACLGIRLPRQASEQGRKGARVKGSLMPGDVLLFRSAASPTGWHTGMYVGRSCFVHASGRKKGVCVSSLRSGRYRDNLVAARRYLNIRA